MTLSMQYPYTISQASSTISNKQWLSHTNKLRNKSAEEFFSKQRISLVCYVLNVNL